MEHSQNKQLEKESNVELIVDDATVSTHSAESAGSNAPSTGSMDSNSAEPEEIDLGDRYTVVSKLGEGASAAVYKVLDKELGKTFAAKVMRKENVPDELARRRFALEAEAASNLTHANLVAIYSHGETSDNAPFLVMDCLDGKTLSQTLKLDGAMDSNRAIEVGVQACEALVHMHMKGVVHRDLKPSNMFLSTDENGMDAVKIVDFGIAKMQYGAEERTQLTQTGEVFGSPLYMSPEQCRGEQLDCRSDIYSLGCVLYELVSGVSPFAAPNPIKSILKHVTGVVPPFKETAPGRNIPKGLQSVIFKCLKTDPQDRYQIVEELLNDLKTLRDSGKVEAAQSEVYASKLRRVTAMMLDAGIITLLTAGVSCALGLFQSSPGFWMFTAGMASAITVFLGPVGAIYITWSLASYQHSELPIMIFATLAMFVVHWLYYALFESSELKGTPGKLALGLAVVDDNGKRLPFRKASMRFLSRAYLMSLGPLVIRLRTLQLPYLKRIWHVWVEMFRNIDHPATDDWNHCYVVNSSMLNNPYVPNLAQKFKQEKLDLTDIHVRMKEIKNHFFGKAWMMLWTFGLAAVYTWLTIDGKEQTSVQVLILIWVAVIYCNFAMTYPAIVLYRRLNVQKKELIESRKKRIQAGISE